MATTIITKFGSGAPAASDVVRGELAVDTENKRLYTENSGGSVVELGTNPTTLAVDTDTLVVDATNNRVGIGTTSPSVALEVSGQIKNNNGYLIDNGTNAGFLTVDGSNVNFGSSTAAKGLAFFTAASSQAMTINSSGNVGIGTASPSNPLTVLGSAGTIASFTNGADADLLIKADSAVTTLTPTTGTLAFGTSSTERMRIDSGGNVGIGNNAPAGYGKFVIQGTGNLLNLNATSGVAYQAFYENGTGRFYFGTLNGSDGLAFIDADGSTEHMRIDASGNLFIGKTNNSLANNGVVLRNDGELFVTRNGDVAQFNRLSSDGVLVYFNKDGSQVGSIGTVSGLLGIGSGDCILAFDASGNAMYPMSSQTGGASDGDLDLGISGRRFKDLYLSGDVKFNDASSAVRNDGGELYLIASSNIRNQASVHTFSNSDGSSEYARIDSSGNLLVGKTSTSFGTDGFQANADGQIWATNASASVTAFNRRTSDGAISVFYKDGSVVGNIGTANGDSITIGNSTGNLILYAATVAPASTSAGGASDGAVDLGASGRRFKDLYRSGSTISTSDRNMKQDERDLTEAETRVAQACKGLLKAFRFIDAVEVDGDNARIHFGIIAQDLQAAFEAEGLDATKYAMFRPSTYTDDQGNEQTRLGVCYENLLAFIIATI